MPRNRFTQLSFLLLLSAVTTVAIAAPPPGKGGGGGGKNNASLSVSVTPDSFTEDAGATGSVTRENSGTSGRLTVTLTNSAPEQVTVPATVDIEDGFASATFPVTGIEESEFDGDQSVTISASALDHSDASTSITLLDNDGLTYSIQWISNPFYPLYSADGNSVMDLNESGKFVGRLESYDSIPYARLGVYFDGTQLIAIDELPAMEALSAQGWFADVATGINDSGQIAVGMKNSDGSQDIFRYEPTGTFTRTFSGDWGPVAINNQGDLAFSNYQPAGTLKLYIDGVGLVEPKPDGIPLPSYYVTGVNDSLQVAGLTTDPDISGRVYRYDAVFDSLITFTGSDGFYGGINSSGDVLYTAVISTKRNRREYAPAVYTDSTDEVRLIDWPNAVRSDMNDNGDVLLWDGISFKPYLVKSGGGELLIDTEVRGIEEDLSKWQTAVVLGQAMNNLGQIAGSASITLSDGTESQEFFILTPVDLTP